MMQRNYNSPIIIGKFGKVYSLAVSYNIKHKPYCPAILILVIYPREMKAYVYTNSNT